MAVLFMYEVALGDQVELFVETVSGALDFVGSFSKEEAEHRVAGLFRSANTNRERLRPVRDYGHGLYTVKKDRARVTVVGDTTDNAPPAGVPEIRAFFLRYPDIADALAEGDYCLVARLVQRSRKLRPFLHLISHIAGYRMADGFALHWFDEGADEASLERLLRGDADEGIPLARAFRAARPHIDAETLQEYREEAADAILGLFGSESRVVLPVVGGNYRPCLGELMEFVTEARMRARTESLLSGTDEKAAQARIDRYLASVEVTLASEPHNPVDRNAVAVLLRLPGREELEHLGYIRRSIAAFLSPHLRRKGNAGARLYRLSEYGCEIRVGGPDLGSDVQ